MYVDTIHYKGFDGEDLEETVRLNLTEAELMNLDVKYAQYGGLINYIRKLLTDMKDGEMQWTPMYVLLRTIILAAYGQRTPDGKFVKKMYGASLADDFESSEAFSVFIMDLLKSLADDGESSKFDQFMLGVFPVNEDAAEKLQAERERLTRAMA